MPVRLSNINLFVADVAASVAFYSTTIGLEPDGARSVPPGFAILRSGELTLTLQSAETPGAVLGRAEGVEIGFETDDLDGLRARLASAGVAVGPVQAMGWGTAFDARDPDGVRLTVFRRRGGPEG